MTWHCSLLLLCVLGVCVLRRPKNRREFDWQLFTSDAKCRERAVARVISTLNLLIQPRSTSGIVECLTAANIDAVEKEVPPPARVNRRNTWVVCVW